MMRSRFDAELDELNVALIEMGAMIEKAIDDACAALVTNDEALARRTMAGDEQINRKERDIESLCLRLLLRQQPVARDLRLISAAMKMITDMERIGDQAQDISEIVTFISAGPRPEMPEHIPNMAAVSIRMVHESVDAFVKRDLSLARQVIRTDDEVDDMFRRVKAEIGDMLSQNREQAEGALDLLMIAKYFERIADHAVNIAEWVEFSVTGVHKGERLQ